MKRALLGLSVVGMCFVAASARAKDPSETKARALFAQAQKDYDLGRFDVALKEYSDAYELKPLPAFLFNIAQCHRQLGNFERAAFFYQRYLDLSPNPPANEAVVKDLIQEVKGKQAELERKKEQEAEEARKLELARAEAEQAQAAAKREEEVRQQRELEAQRAALTPSTVPGAAVSVKAQPEESPPLYKRWWFWTGVAAVGIVVVAAAATSKTSLPRSTLGELDERTAP